MIVSTHTQFSELIIQLTGTFAFAGWTTQDIAGAS
jgi:hypothetical protein